jgi:hypothetical protein
VVSQDDGRALNPDNVLAVTGKNTIKVVMASLEANP